MSPRPPAEHPRSNVTSVRLSDEEHAAAKAAAQREDLPLSIWMRRAVNAAASARAGRRSSSGPQPG